MHDRLIPFDRILNFRDYGGWETPHGKITRGKLFRSASFHDATEADIAKLNTMDLRFLVDLRRPEERAHEPSKWSNESCRIIFNDEGGGGHALPPHLVALMQSELTPQSTRDYMLSLYREIPFDPRLVGLYRDWFAALGEGGAGVVHCAAGKDRTGIICALTLTALGVDEDAIFADYEFTNEAVDLEARMPRIQQRIEERLGRKLDSAALKPMLGVHVDYLREALNAIDAKYGSALNYIEQELGVGASALAKLRDNLSA
ncbi:MAG TPA: tyrosine-protein phosphatase [Vitreimonas sp.]|uniref:tyrosine-protein phosphatase n=1 Tax=Vitreimonas sp. TaxID=3069702 RepID=UPI002D589073|nr:tyrosine-protein phosphatase [Vitreimonas sp.]HYD86594.1 tyrosine-protein phosphatase [Vitreimonas sp.]